MEDIISDPAEKMIERNTPLEETYSSYTKDALRIAEVALSSFSGNLLHKALTIAESIVEFENELLNKEK